MAFRKILAQRLFDMSKISHSPFSFPLAQRPLIPPDPAKTLFNRDFRSGLDSGKDGFFRRFLQKREIVQSAAAAAASPEVRSLTLGDKLVEKLKGVNTSRDRLRLDGLIPPATRSETVEQISVEDLRKLLRLSRLEMLKTKLRGIPKPCISYSEFVQICSDGCSSPDQGLESAKMLDQSGTVIVWGNVVFLRPEQVVQAVEASIPISIAHPDDPRRKELEEMEKEKMVIDEKADALVRRELWAGLGFLVLQTAAFMRLTFWELSWDVMEPICFYVTTFYFMTGYTFFMRTSKEPSFEGFYKSRFSAKQKRLMKNKNFNIQRFNELRKAYNSFSSEPSPSLNHSGSTLFGAALHN